MRDDGGNELVSGGMRWNEQADELIERLRSINRPRIIVISGPSGVGKDTVIERMRERHPEFAFAVTATTRERRPGEIPGVHYIFMSRRELAEAVERHEFLESAEVYGHLYGVPRERVMRELRTGKHVVVKVDVQGAATIRKLNLDCIFIFLAPPSMAALTRRLRNRKTEDPEILMERLGTALRELRRASEFDYVVFNEDDEVEATLDAIDAIITAESARILPTVEGGA